ncbi:hypothetical protein [Myroides odoratus]|uniref:hypothetical protein n=1 Tax=Myroides odoratus TaxID=256 RepID=UPI003340B9F8
MYDYPEKIKDYLYDNFVPGTKENANLKKTTKELLNFLFRIFPFECIDDYQLVDILYELGYKPINLMEKNEEKQDVLSAYWLLAALPSL